MALPESSQTLTGAASPIRPQWAVDVTLPGPLQPSAVQIAADMIRAVIAKNSATSKDIAQARYDASILYDSLRAQEIRDASCEPAKAEDLTERAQGQQNREARGWFRTRQRAVDHCVEVSEVLAALDGRVPTSAPLAITWDGTVIASCEDIPDGIALLPCTTARGGHAALVLNGDPRMRMVYASFLGLGALDVNVPSRDEGCSAVEDHDSCDAAPCGWFRLAVAALGGGPRWYCSDTCVIDALAHAGHSRRRRAPRRDGRWPVRSTTATCLGWELLTHFRGCARPAWTVDVRIEDGVIRPRRGGVGRECGHRDRFTRTIVRIVYLPADSRGSPASRAARRPHGVDGGWARERAGLARAHVPGSPLRRVHEKAELFGVGVLAAQELVATAARGRTEQDLSLMSSPSKGTGARWRRRPPRHRHRSVRRRRAMA